MVAPELDGRDTTPSSEYERAGLLRQACGALTGHRLAGVPAVPQRRSSGSCCNWMTLPFSDSFEFDCRSWTGIRTVTSSAYPSNRLVHPVDGAPTRGASVSFSNLPTIPNTPCSKRRMRMRDIRISRSFLLCVELEGRSGSVRRVGVVPGAIRRKSSKTRRSHWRTGSRGLC